MAVLNLVEMLVSLQRVTYCLRLSTMSKGDAIIPLSFCVILPLIFVSSKPKLMLGNYKEKKRNFWRAGKAVDLAHKGQLAENICLHQ